MTEPEGESLEGALREIDRLAKEEELTTGHIPNPFHVAMFKGMMRAAASTSGRAFKFLLDPENEDALSQIRTPTGRNRFRERLARTLESGTVEENRKLIQECAWYAGLTPKQKAEMLRAPKQRELAASIRTLIEPEESPPGVTPGAEAVSGGLKESERIMLARALKLAGSEFNFDRLIEARRGEDWETFAELSFRLNLSVALALIPPPPDEPFGRRNRSKMRLRAERKHCGAPLCDKVIPNRSTYCLLHSRSAIQERDTEKKGQKAMAARLLRTSDMASRAGTSGSQPFMGDTLPEEFAPTIKKRRLTQ